MLPVNELHWIILVSLYACVLCAAIFKKRWMLLAVLTSIYVGFVLLALYTFGPEVLECFIGFGLMVTTVALLFHVLTKTRTFRTMKKLLCITHRKAI